MIQTGLPVTRRRRVEAGSATSSSRAAARRAGRRRRAPALLPLSPPLQCGGSTGSAAYSLKMAPAPPMCHGAPRYATVRHGALRCAMVRLEQPNRFSPLIMRYRKPCTGSGSGGGGSGGSSGGAQSHFWSPGRPGPSAWWSCRTQGRACTMHHAPRKAGTCRRPRDFPLGKIVIRTRAVNSK